MKNHPDLTEPNERSIDTCTHPNRVMLWANDPGKDRVLIYRPGCGLWSCPGCRKTLQRYWVLRVGKHVSKSMKDGGLWEFVTVTSHEKLKTLEATIAVWPKAWSKLYNKLKYNTPGKLQYVLVPELHENGRMHAHLIVEQTLPTRWWKDAARKAGLGYMAEAEPLNHEWSAAWYVSKYLGKNVGEQDFPKGFRRIRTSQGWPELEPMQGDGVTTFEVIPTKAQQLIALKAWRKSGATVYDLTDGRYIFHDGEFVDSLTIW